MDIVNKRSVDRTEIPVARAGYAIGQRQGALDRPIGDATYDRAGAGVGTDYRLHATSLPAKRPTLAY